MTPALLDPRSWLAASAVALPALLYVAWAWATGRLGECLASLARTEPAVTAEDRAAELVWWATHSPGGRFGFGRVAIERLSDRGPWRVYTGQTSAICHTPDGARRLLAYALRRGGR